MFRVFAALMMSGLLSACSMLTPHSSRSSFESFVWSQLRDKSLMSEGASLINMRWIAMRSEYFDKRTQMLGFEDALTQEFKASSKPFLMLALQMKPSGSFSKSDFEVFWNDKKLEVHREVVSVLELKSLYPFAYPFHRVFLYQLSDAGTGPGNLVVRTPWGKLEDQESR